MHHRKSRVIVGGRKRRGIYLGPAEPEHAADHAHQSVFDVFELRRLQRALAVDHDERMLVGREYAVIVVAPEYGIGETFAGIARTTSDQGVSHGTVVVVDDANGRGGRRRLNVGGNGDGAVRIHSDVRAIHVFGELAATGGCESRRWDGGPLAERVGDQRVGGCVGQDWAEIALIRVISDEPLRPDERLPGGGRVEVTGAGDRLGPAGAGKQGEEKDDRPRQGQPEEK